MHRKNKKSILRKMRIKIFFKIFKWMLLRVSLDRLIIILLLCLIMSLRIILVILIIMRLSRLNSLKLIFLKKLIYLLRNKLS